jgi:hypothetical protein
VAVSDRVAVGVCQMDWLCQCGQFDTRYEHRQWQGGSGSVSDGLVVSMRSFWYQIQTPAVAVGGRVAVSGRVAVKFSK